MILKPMRTLLTKLFAPKIIGMKSECLKSSAKSFPIINRYKFKKTFAIFEWKSL